MRNFFQLFAAPFTVFILAGCCSLENDNNEEKINYRQEMRDFVKGISSYARSLNPDFIVIPQNGHELVSEDGEPDGNPVNDYLEAIDGAGQEDLDYGYEADDLATPQSAREYLMGFLDIAESKGVEVLVINYCSTEPKVDDSYTKSDNKGYISFAADHRELDNIPGYPSQPHHDNSNSIGNLAEAKNFLYLLNSSDFPNKAAYIDAVDATNYDLFIIDMFYDGTEELTSADTLQLKSKPGSGNARLVISYMSIGEAEDYRYYWQPSWVDDPPSWLGEENPDWPGNYKVKYWNKEWQNIIYGNDNSYLKKIIDAGFDGVYLDIIDAFEYFEDK